MVLLNKLKKFEFYIQAIDPSPIAIESEKKHEIEVLDQLKLKN